MPRPRIFERVYITCPCGNKKETAYPALTKYCSKKCFYKYRKRPSGLKYIIVVKNRKGHVAWNRGMKNQYGTSKKGKKYPDRQGPHWKGDNASYRAKHIWIETRLGKANHCSFDKLHESSRYHWANISHEYKRDLNDWIQLCPTCHSAYDNDKGNIKNFINKYHDKK